MKKEFPKDDMRELVWESVGSGFEGYELVAIEDQGTSRWSSLHRMIFRHEGELWAVSYSKGLSETQDEQPFEYSDAIATRVKPVERVVTLTDYVDDPDA